MNRVHNAQDVINRFIHFETLDADSIIDHLLQTVQIHRSIKGMILDRTLQVKVGDNPPVFSSVNSDDPTGAFRHVLARLCILCQNESSPRKWERGLYGFECETTLTTSQGTPIDVHCITENVAGRPALLIEQCAPDTSAP